MVGDGFSAALEGGGRRLLRGALAWLQNPRPSPLGLANKGIFGQNLRMQRRDWYREDLQELLRLCAEGAIKPVIGRVLALEEAATAHRLLGAADVVGKIVLQAPHGSSR